MRSGQYAASPQDADTGEGYQEFMGGGLLSEVRLSWPRCVYNAFGELLPSGQSSGPQDLFLGYSYLEGSYEWL
jgi:hypothetical protein